MQAERWRVATFAELIDEGVLQIGDGYRAENAELGGNGPIFLRAGHVTDTHIDFAGVDRFREELAEKVRPKMSRAGDVVVTTKGNSTGRVTFVTPSMPPFVYSPHLSYWRALDPGRLSTGFLRYWSRGRQFHQQLAGLKASTDMAPYLSLADQKRLRVSLPPIEHQETIADILGSLDDKIDLNRRMNETLEAIARALFRSWFVDFDPVRAKAEGRQPTGMDFETARLFPDSFENSLFGQIPSDWRVSTLGEYCEQITDGAHESPPSVGDGLPMASVKDLTNWGVELGECRSISPVDFERLVSAGCRPRRGDVLLAKDGAYCLETACEFQQDDAMVLLSSIAILRPKLADGSSFLHLWLTMDSTRHYLKEGFRSGSAIPRVVLRDLKRAQLIVPDSQTIQQFDRLIRPCRMQARLNTESCKTLADLRDALLPKLLSGEIRVKDAEAALESVR